jgi:hypothetical protein
MKFKSRYVRGLLLAGLLSIMALLPPAGVDAAGKTPPPGALTDQEPTAYQGLTPEQVERVRQDEIVILDRPETVEGRQMITAAFVFNQDIDTVWTLMTSGWRQEEYLPNLKRSQLIKKWNGGDILEMTVEIMGVSIQYRVLGKRDKSKYHSSWTLDPGFDNDMKEVSGFFQFYWIDAGHTLARYGSWVEVGIWIPRTVQEYMTKKNLPEALGAQKKFVDSGGTYKKEGYVPPSD